MKNKLLIVLTFSAQYLGANQPTKEALLAAQLEKDKEELQNFVACNKNEFVEAANAKKMEAEQEIKEKLKEIKNIEFTAQVFKALYEKKPQIVTESSVSAQVIKSTVVVEEKLHAILRSGEWRMLRTADLRDPKNLKPLVNIAENIQQDFENKRAKNPDKENEFIAERAVILSILAGFLRSRAE
jgi:hypothetical protein